MTLLLIFAALVAVVTVWFLARPLRAAATAPSEDREALLQLRDRLLGQLREIEVESGDRNIDVNVAADERVRLEAELARVLKELDQTTKAGDKAQGAAKGLWLNVALALAAIIPIASAALYFGMNSAMLTQLADVKSAANATAPPKMPPMVLEMVGRLEKRLAEQPADPKGWAQLGRAYSVLGRQADARQAYARAYQQAPNDVEILQAYGTFLVSLNPSRLVPEAVPVFTKLLALDPKNMGALWALGIVAYHDQKFAQAANYWERLLKILPPENEAVPELKRAVENARAQAGAGRTKK
jgi:cytochrome c-type biogenesis protein CcmH